LTSLGKFGLRA